jgi:hypothetical protein
LKYRGKEKFQGEPAVELEYRMAKGSGGFDVSLYFDPQNFRHVGSKYKIRLAAPIGGYMSSGGGSVTFQNLDHTRVRVQIEESFSDFQIIDSLSLPRSWSLRLVVDGSQGTQVYDWHADYTSITHNQFLDPEQFVARMN